MTENFSFGLLCSIGMKRFKRGKIRSEELYLDVEKTPNITVLKKIRHSIRTVRKERIMLLVSQQEKNGRREKKVYI